MTLKILLADDQKEMRNNLLKLIEKEPDMKVVAESESGEETLKLTREIMPDVVIMDVVMPDMNGVEVTRQIKGAFPTVKILAVSMYSDKRFVDGMFDAGASGYLIKDDAFHEIAVAIRHVMANKRFVSDQLVHKYRKEENRVIKSLY